MANDERISEGDDVTVWIYQDQRGAESMTVLGVPCATGDCWKFKDTQGNIHYVQQFVEIIKRNPHGEREG